MRRQKSIRSHNRPNSSAVDDAAALKARALSARFLSVTVRIRSDAGTRLRPNRVGADCEVGRVPSVPLLRVEISAVAVGALCVTESKLVAATGDNWLSARATRRILWWLPGWGV